MDKSPDKLVKEISEILPNGENFWDLCNITKYFADNINVKNPTLSLGEYETILKKSYALIEISFILNINYKPFIESNNEFKKSNPEFNVREIYAETVAAISSKLSEIGIRYDEYYDSFYDENTGGVVSE